MTPSETQLLYCYPGVGRNDYDPGYKSNTVMYDRQYKSNRDMYDDAIENVWFFTTQVADPGIDILTAVTAYLTVSMLPRCGVYDDTM